eukprot:jgi/Mesvir1/2700/Mv22879-RA.1
MAHLVEQEGNLRWVNYVIENAMYTDKVTMVYNNVTAAADLGASVTAGTSQVVANGVITTAGVDPKLAIRFKIPLSAGGYNNDQVFEIQDAVIPREYKFTPTSYATTANDRATWIARPPSLAAKLICRYIYLDDFERRQFAVNPHEYLITEYQHHQQFLGANTDQVVVDLKFNHPTKELIFFYRPDEWWTEDLKDYYKGYWSFKNVASSFGEGHLFTTANLILNSQNVYADGRDPVYFDYVVPNQFHKRVDKDSHVYVIPFSMQPDSWKPSGSINMSRLDDVKLVLKGMGTTTPAGTLNVYAKNFNVMKIMNGMGGKRTAPATGTVSGTVPLTNYKIVASTSFYTNALRLAEVKRILGLMDTGSTLYVTRRETSNLTNIMWAKDQTLNWILNEVDLAKTSAATGSGTNETTYPTAALTKGQAYVMTWTTSLPDPNPTSNAKEQLMGFLRGTAL